MKFNRLLAAVLALATVFSLVACGAASDPKDTEPVLRDPGFTTEATEPSGTSRPEDITDEEDPIVPEETESEGDHRVEEDEEEIQEDEEFDPDDLIDEEDSSSSSSGSDEPTKDDSGDETGTSSAGTATPLSWDALNAFPIKSSSMSVAQLRQLCVDYFRYAKTATWIPSQSISFVRNSKGANDSMSGGNQYGGLPYIGLGSGTMYRLMDYLDPATGVVDMADALNINGTISMAGMKYFGNQCANGAFSGWGRVINSVNGTATTNMTQQRGYFRVGPYTYKDSIKNWNTNNQTTAVCEANGRQVMYESYAKLQPADGMVYYTTAGHVIMASSAPVVVRAADGSIDGKASYIYIIDQAQTWEKYNAVSGTCMIKNSVDSKKTFADLYDRHYLPFTFGEFLGTDPVQGTSCDVTIDKETISTEDLFSCEVTSNYFISDAYILLTNSSGTQVYKHAVRGSAANCRALTLSRTGAHVDSWGTYPTSGSYTVEIQVQLYTGERKTVYTGTLKV